MNTSRMLDMERTLIRRLRDRYEALTDKWPHRCWNPFDLGEPGILVKTNPQLFLK